MEQTIQTLKGDNEELMKENASLKKQISGFKTSNANYKKQISHLKQLDKAVAAYDKAIDLAGDNKDYVPSFMLKKANVLHSMKKYDDELAIYQEIETKYWGPGAVDAQIERAKALAGK